MCHLQYNGNRGVVTKLETKLAFKAEQIIRATESLDSSRQNGFHTNTQQLEGKLSLLNEMDNDILDCCELQAIETEIEESEAIVAKMINCRQKIELFIASTPTGRGDPPSTVSYVPLPPLTTFHKPPPPPSVAPSIS